MLADVAFPAWQPHPDVWLLVAAFAVGLRASRSTGSARGSRRPGTPVVTRFQIATFSAGLLALWVASDWPIHDLGERYLFSVHMVQHIDVLDHRRAAAADRHAHLAGALAALAAVVAAHGALPVAADPGDDPLQPRGDRHAHAGRRERGAASTRSLHFAMHTLIFVSSLIVWMPLLSPLPEVPRLPPLGRMLFLFLQSVVPTVPASFLTFGDHPLYRSTRRPAPVGRLGARRHAVRRASIMKIGVGLHVCGSRSRSSSSGGTTPKRPDRRRGACRATSTAS